MFELVCSQLQLNLFLRFEGGDVWLIIRAVFSSTESVMWDKRGQTFHVSTLAASEGEK